MPTNTPATTARRNHTQQINYLRLDFAFGDTGAMTVGILPAGAIIHKAMSGVDVQVAFNNGTTNTLNIGTAANDDLYGTALATGSIAFVPLDEAVSMKVAADTTIIATQAVSGTAASAGQASVIIAYTLEDKTA